MKNSQRGFLLNPFRMGTPEFDPYYANTSLIVNGNGANGSTTVTDISPTPKILTCVNGAAISTAQYKFNGSSIAFDGVNDFIDAGYHPDYVFGASDFTIEFSFLARTLANMRIINNGERGYYHYPSCEVGINNGYIGVTAGANTVGADYASISSSEQCSINTWYHVQWCRYGINQYLFINGTLRGSMVWNKTIARNTNPLYIGALYAISQLAYFNGFLAGIRITKGIARNTSDFVPPSSAFPGF